MSVTLAGAPVAAPPRRIWRHGGHPSAPAASSRGHHKPLLVPGRCAAAAQAAALEAATPVATVGSGWPRRCATKATRRAVFAAITSAGPCSSSSSSSSGVPAAKCSCMLSPACATHVGRHAHARAHMPRWRMLTAARTAAAGAAEGASGAGAATNEEEVATMGTGFEPFEAGCLEGVERAVVWLKHDLRLDDHPALDAAARCETLKEVRTHASRHAHMHMHAHTCICAWTHAHACLHTCVHVRSCRWPAAAASAQEVFALFQAASQPHAKGMHAHMHETCAC
eukprot:186808-Chlamydomonas_euryale.AAC.4